MAYVPQAALSCRVHPCALLIFRLAVRMNALAAPIANGSAPLAGRRAADPSAVADAWAGSARAAAMSAETLAETEPFLELSLALEFSRAVYWRDMLYACFEAQPALPERLVALAVGTVLVLLTVIRRRCFLLM